MIFESYYDKVEYLIGVSGKGGSNPFESKRARDYPLPPLREMGYGTIASDAMTKLGYHPFPQPTAIISQDYRRSPRLHLLRLLQELRLLERLEVEHAGLGDPARRGDRQARDAPE